MSSVECQVSSVEKTSGCLAVTDTLPTARRLLAADSLMFRAGQHLLLLLLVADALQDRVPFALLRHAELLLEQLLGGPPPLRQLLVHHVSFTEDHLGRVGNACRNLHRLQLHLQSSRTVVVMMIMAKMAVFYVADYLRGKAQPNLMLPHEDNIVNE